MSVPSSAGRGRIPPELLVAFVGRTDVKLIVASADVRELAAGAFEVEAVAAHLVYGVRADVQ